ncbi:hypothetical protein SDC9_14131 [bioreactor metagenome]|uniref:ATPase AAA-type core domain-containing protein n=1 Tax=bioreactor metagenome TaxID=1076179 RepID=A0A644TNA3_9ZZZZ
MELVYLWVEDYKNIKKQGFNFSPRFRCEFFPVYEKYTDEKGEEKEKLKDDCELKITPKENHLKDFFGKNINITAIVGENGSGKSSILEIIKYGSSSNYDFKTRTETIYPQCFYVLYDKNNDLYIFKGAEEKQNNSIKNIFYVKYSDKNINKIFQNIYYSSSDTFHSYPELSTSYQISEHITNVTNAYMYQKLAETIQINHKHKLTSYKQLMDYLIDIHIENGILAFYKNNMKFPNHFNKPTNLVFYIDYKYIYTEFKGLKLDENLHNKLQGLMSKSQKNDRNNIEYMIKHFSILCIIVQYDRGLKNTVDFKIEDFFNGIDFTSSTLDIIDSIIAKLNKKYFIDGVENNIIEEYFKSIFRIIELLKDFDKYYKNEMFIIPIDLETDKILELIDLHKNITATTFSFFSYSFEPLMSGGHNQFFNFFAKLFYALNYPYNSLPRDNKKILLFLDEPDVFLHPNWQQKYINILINFLNINYSQYKFHIIITSHSSFILSDLPKENIIFLEKGKQVYPFEDGKQTFGANIHTLLSHGFFMKDGLMGEFAKDKIDTAIKYLNQKVLTNDELDYCENIISIIGEPIIKRELQRMLDSKRLSEIGLIKKQIAELQKELDKKENKK